MKTGLAVRTDGELVEMVQSGHPGAFEAIVRRYSPELTRYCCRIGLSHTAAEDALQAAFMRAWVALENETRVRELRPWLHRIVHNTALNILRDAPDLLSCDDATTEAALPPTGEAEGERRLAVLAALADVAALPRLQREAILMSAVDGRSHEEVANALGVSGGAVRGLLYRARATLRAAAAAISPAPLAGWVSRHASRFPGCAGRLAEASAQAAGPELGGAFIKGAAAAATALVLVGGAVDVTLHHHGDRTGHTGAPRAALHAAARSWTAQPGAGPPAAVKIARSGAASASGRLVDVASLPAAPSVSRQQDAGVQPGSSGSSPTGPGAAPAPAAPSTPAVPAQPIAQPAGVTPAPSAPSSPGAAGSGAAGSGSEAPAAKGSEAPASEGGTGSAGTGESPRGGEGSDDGGSDDGSKESDDSAGGSDSHSGGSDDREVEGRERKGSDDHKGSAEGDS